jgi:hypothetical protein
MRQLAREFKLVRDPSLDRYLQQIADRMAAVAGTGPVRVELLDLPVVNAVTFPGGRILVSRKMIAFARSEDEVAAVLAHELAHVIARDPERTMSARLRQMFNITSVGDAGDIEAKYNQMVDNARRKPVPRDEKQSEEAQQKADALAVWLIARTGYAPQAFADFWNRFQELQANTGSWFSDLFGTTKPEAMRLRVALAAAASFPPACRGERTTTEHQFVEWQRLVREAPRAARPTVLHGVISEKKIDPPLRSTVSRLRFSPDGRWVSAQDDSSVYVFARDGLAFQFRIDAPDAYEAQFTPESSAIVFYDPEYRVERWSLASEERETVHEVAPNQGCLQSALAPDGQTLACATSDWGVRLYDVSTGGVVFEKTFYTLNAVDDAPDLWRMAASGNPNPQFYQMRFSPNARYLVVARRFHSLAVDVEKRQAVSLPGSIRDRIGGAFTFVGSDRIAGLHIYTPQESGIVTFPGGAVVQKLALGRHSLAAPTRGDAYLFLGQVQAPLAVGLFAVKENKLVGGSRTFGIDVYDDLCVSELRGGQLALQKIGESKALAVAAVPSGPLSRLRAADISPGLDLLAVSQSSRGVVWDLQSGKAISVRGFRGARAEAGQAYLDFPPEGQAPRAVIRMEPNTQSGQAVVQIEAPRPAGELPPGPGQAAGASPISAKVVASEVRQHGGFLVGVKDGRKKDDGRSLAVFDARTGRELWTMALAGRSGGAMTVSPEHHCLIFLFNYAAAAARSIADANPAVVRQFEGLKAKKEDVGLLEVFDLGTGRLRGHVLVDFGRSSFLSNTAVAKGDHLLLGDTANRTLVYSLRSGALLGRAFGQPLDLATGADRVCVQNAAGEVSIYSMPEMQKVDEYSFPSAAVFARFSGDGKRLFVLTQDQTAYTIDLTAPAGAPPTR